MTSTASTPATLGERIPAGGVRDVDQIFDLFVAWARDRGFHLYAAQEEALLELMSARHVVLSTPTGSGKSLVALGLHFKAICEGGRCYYTSPIKALASEKFFELCDELGAENVGMQTGDASINADAPIICCTAEVLANLALRRGRSLRAPYVVMDEFHYYSDPDRGVAWQVPLITLPDTQFLLMSATLGNTAPIQERLEEFTGRRSALVASMERPVPLDFEYRETPLHETVSDLLAEGKAPIYVVNFTQRECAELAQGFTSMAPATKAERKEIRRTIGDFRFDTPYGRELRRFLGFGIGVHHAGLLPKYRLLVEQLSQRGLLRVICGTDTLGVGVNVPIRTVLFTKLCKFDGTKMIILKVRDFQQICGRAGRKGFDERGSVVCQAPEHDIENARRQQRAAGDAKKLKKLRKVRPPERFLPWDRKTYDRLIHSPPETLESQFRINHHMLLSLLQHDADRDDPELDNFFSLRRLIARCHESPARKQLLISEAAQLVRSLHRAGVLTLTLDVDTGYRWVVVDHELQFNFSLHQSLGLYLVETIEMLDRNADDYALRVLSFAEAIQEDPKALLYRIERKARDAEMARLKAEKVPFEERIRRLEEITYPKPEAERIYDTFNAYRKLHPWVAGENVRPKSIGRELYESYSSFNEFVRRYGVQRSEGLLLRYLSQLYSTMQRTVPRNDKTEQLYDIEAFLRTTVEHTDSSLLEEWESMVHPEIALQEEPQAVVAREALRLDALLADPRAFAAVVRAEMHRLVRALAKRKWEGALAEVRPAPEGAEPWSPERLEESLAGYFDNYQRIDFGPEARQAHHTNLEAAGERRWRVTQTLCDPQGDDLWQVEGRIDLRRGRPVESPYVELVAINGPQ